MNQYEIEKLIQDTKELRDIRDEYQKTERLLKENKQEELQQHLQEVSSKHRLEKLAYNAVNLQMPQTLEPFPQKRTENRIKKLNKMQR